MQKGERGGAPLRAWLKRTNAPAEAVALRTKLDGEAPGDPPHYLQFDHVPSDFAEAPAFPTVPRTAAPTAAPLIHPPL